MKPKLTKPEITTAESLPHDEVITDEIPPSQLQDKSHCKKYDPKCQFCVTYDNETQDQYLDLRIPPSQLQAHKDSIHMLKVAVWGIVGIVGLIGIVIYSTVLIF